MLSLDELRSDVESGAVDTVIACFTDMQGRLMGKRLDAEFFLAESEAGHPGEGCNYLLALEMEMDPVPGYAIASWERGYGDFGLRPDLSTLRRIPWHEATVMVQCDVEWHDGTPVAPSPRQVLRAQVEKAHGLGLEPMFGSELEFFLFRETYLEAHAKHYHDLTPSVPYILDYHILAASFDEPFLRTVRTSMKAAGMVVESSKGEAWAGQIACLGDLAIFVAPVVNSYKRFAAGSWAPTTLAWGYDNRTCGFRVVGHGSSCRPETRIPGADANPYLAFAALLAAGLYGIEEKLELKPAFEGNAYESDVERFPHALREAINRLESSAVARRLLGEEVIDHYLNYARTEQELFDKTVTGYERERMFERG